MAQKTIINLESNLNTFASPHTQSSFQPIKRKAMNLLATLKTKGTRRRDLVPGLQASRIRFVHLSYILLFLFLGAAAYPSMGWNGSLFDCVYYTSNSLFRIGAVLQRVNSLSQRMGLAILSDNIALTGYTTTTKFFDFLTNLPLHIDYPDDFLQTCLPVRNFGLHLLDYNLCKLHRVVSMPELAGLCPSFDPSTDVDFIPIPDPLPFPDPTADSSIGQQSLTIATLTTIVKNKMIELFDQTHTTAFQAGDASAIHKYLKDCVDVSTWLYVWSKISSVLVVL